MLKRMIAISSIAVLLITLAGASVFAQKPEGLDRGGGKTPVVDDTPPEVEISSPQDGDYVTDEVSIEVNATDSSGIAEVLCYLPSGPVQTARRVPCSFTWDPSDVDDGTYEIRVTAIDKADNEADAFLNLIVSSEPNLPPEVSISNPIGGITIFGQVMIEIEATDDFGLSHADFFLGDYSDREKWDLGSASTQPFANPSLPHHRCDGRWGCGGAI